MGRQSCLGQLQLLHLAGGHDGALAADRRLVIQIQPDTAVLHNAAYPEANDQIPLHTLRIDAGRHRISGAALEGDGNFPVPVLGPVCQISYGRPAGSGGFLGNEYERSTLYDPTFTTEFREASK